MATTVTTYTTVNGLLVHDSHGSVQTEYTSDPLGSLIKCKGPISPSIYSAEYWPYGEVQTSQNTKTNPWGFVGLLGYLSEAAAFLYVRARYLNTKFARWITQDQLWPVQKPYAYVASRPVDRRDPMGLAIGIDDILGAIALFLIFCGIITPILVGGFFGGSSIDVCKTCLSIGIAIMAMLLKLSGIFWSIGLTFLKDYLNIVHKLCQIVDKGPSNLPCNNPGDPIIDGGGVPYYDGRIGKTKWS